jgi:hypothetical protein
MVDGGLVKEVLVPGAQQLLAKTPSKAYTA